jgi:hypothetical protein
MKRVDIDIGITFGLTLLKTSDFREVSERIAPAARGAGGFKFLRPDQRAREAHCLVIGELHGSESTSSCSDRKQSCEVC